NDLVYGEDGDDLLHGQRGNDRAYGSGGNDRLFGGNGDDIVNGGSGHDTISGGEGADLIVGGGGNDRLYGDTAVAAADRFRFFADAGDDRIFDFQDNRDQLEFGGIFASVNDVLLATTASGDDAVIDLGGGNSLTLIDYLAAHTIASLGNDILLF
ncbi:MAG TPA: hypothetical protein VHN20_19800, partial [Beijerinckiaceae bacterium]|nr:hypothetical protein [Beijerinckiaceae bacterium]